MTVPEVYSVPKGTAFYRVRLPIRNEQRALHAIELVVWGCVWQGPTMQAIVLLVMAVCGLLLPPTSGQSYSRRVLEALAGFWFGGLIGATPHRINRSPHRIWFSKFG